MRGVDAAEVSLDDTRLGRFDAWRPVRRASEESLVRAAQRGSERAVEELFSRHWPDAYRTALLIAQDRAAAEDIVQDVLVELWRRPESFDPQRAALRGWLSMLARRRGIDTMIGPATALTDLEPIKVQ